MNNKWYKRSGWLAGLSLCLSMVACNKSDQIIVDVSQEGAEVPSSLYGVFFEEITHSGDGGLYAEMVLNRGFEDGNLPSGTVYEDGYAVSKDLPCYSNDSINHFKVKWQDGKAMNGWEVVCAAGQPVYKVVDNQPLHPATPHALQLELGKSAGDVQVINNGYWGMALTKGSSYKLAFYLKADAASDEEVSVALIDENNQPAASQNFKITRDNQWHRYDGTLVSASTGNKYRLALTFKNKGTIYLDYVSLFPEETFMDRPNGMRKDVAEMLADLHPAFIRWPGGCIVEGLNMANRVKWKETIGDPVTRPGEYNLWGYRSTYGFGYHEFLQFCEDVHADGMFVCNAGMACLFRNGDFCDDKQVDDLIQEALDAIEYAIGDTDTYWGKKRAENGHPAPFPLKYVEIGNENIGSRYAANYKRFYAAIKEKYPQITPICALMFSPYLQEAGPIDIIDPHYYETADWFYRNGDLYDKLPADYPYKIYVGEYAATGRSSLYSSLAEAAYLTGVERNADKVQLVSYAPLLENADGHGRNHLIVLKNDSVYGRTNYHILKMFSDNRPDVNLKTQVLPAETQPIFQTQGILGIGTCNTVAEFKDFKVTRDGETVYATDWSDLSSAWTASQGEWSLDSGILKQSKVEGDSYLWLNGKELGDCTIELKAQKLEGREGFRIFFGSKGEEQYFMADIGSHTNESVIFGERNAAGNVSLFDYRNATSVNTYRWYDVRIEIKGNHWKCYLDNQLEYEYTYQPVIRHYAVSGYDKQTNEVVIKLVNGENTPWNTSINLSNMKSVQAEGTQITLSGVDPDDENSFANPEKVVPVETVLKGIKPSFEMVCQPNSFTILRIPCER
nr:alpha-L-arabinofuranosidase C-terminal domain-containing protein [Parabacteroides goldsteinii]